jgi:predicted dienelactone hydrolase
MIFAAVSRHLSTAAAIAFTWACSSPDIASRPPGVTAGDSAGSAPGQAGAARERGVLRRPQGPYDVGVREFTWVDTSRDEIFTSDPADRRRIKITALYPVARAGAGDTPVAPYVNAYEFAPEVAAVLGGLTMQARGGAPLLAGDAPLPVLVFNHGFSTYRMTGSFVMLELASRGYVVFTVEHPGASLAVRLVEGEPAIVFDQSRAPAVSAACDAACLDASETYVERIQLPEWVRDDEFLLARLDAKARAEAAQPPPEGAFFGRLALDRVGVFGWSLGGSTALQLTVDGPPSVAAVIDYDGAPRGAVEAVGPGATPVMLLHAEGTWQPGAAGDPAQALHDAQIASLEAIHRSATGPTFDYTLTGAEHGAFSDGARLTDDAASSTLAVARHDAIVELTAAFFDRFIGGGAGAPADASMAALDALAAGLPGVRNTRPAE